MELIRIILSGVIALCVSMPMCCCGITPFGQKDSIKEVSCCSKDNSFDQSDSPCEGEQCLCFKKPHKITDTVDGILPKATEVNFTKATELWNLLQIPHVKGILIFYEENLPPPPELAFTKQYSIYRL